MSDRPPPSETQSLRGESDPREIARRARERADTEHPTQIGPYRILQPLGEGGMGTVYLAEQTKPIHRKVALKIIKLGMDTKSVITRFEAEREALALMNHPNVAKVFDAGATETGRPYFVMEYVEGVPLTQFCDDRRLTLHERLHLFMQICQAVQHAHQKGIIHRDLKPSNVLVSQVDGQPSVKVIDFGIAKATQQKLTEQTFATEQGMLVGTPAYMSPEQADPFTQDIDTRTDIYSLGVILYELLVGTLPFEPDSLRQAALSEIQRIIREVDPPKPSSRVGSAGRTPSRHEPHARGPSALPPYQGGTEGGSSATDTNKEPLPHGRGSDSRDRGSDQRRRSDVATIASRRGTDPKSLHRQVRGDLDWIAMKCLEKDRTRRYDTANALVMELQRFLNNEPVTAGPPSRAYRLKKFVRRNRAGVLGATAVSAVLVLGIVTTNVMLVRARAAEERERTERVRAEDGERNAESARAEAEQVTQFLSDMLAAVDPGQQGKDVTVREVLDRASERISQQFAGKPLTEARLLHTVGTTYYHLGLYDRAEAYSADAAAIYRRVLGERDPRTLVAMSSLAGSIRSVGEYSASEASQRSTLEIMRRVLGEEHPDTLQSMNNLGSVLDAEGRYSEAEELYRKTLEIRRRVHGEEHPNTLMSMKDLGNVLDGEGRYAAAEELLRKAFEISRRVLGEEHPNTLMSMSSLGNVLGHQGRYREAEELYRKTLEIERHVLGHTHPETLTSMSNLATMLSDEARYSEAEELYRETLEIGRRALGEEHPDTLASMGNLGNLLADEGRFSEAEELYRKTLETMCRVLGKEHPNTLSLMNNLGASLSDQGRYAEAEPLLIESYEAGERRDADLPPTDRKAMLDRFVRLYESWDAAEPGKGYAEQAAEWRAKRQASE